MELLIESIDSKAIEVKMPEIVSCFNWLDGLRGKLASDDAMAESTP
jgi:hypothetical protein